MIECSKYGPALYQGTSMPTLESKLSAVDKPNARGLLWSKVLKHTDIYAVSLSTITQDQIFTYASGSHRTKIGYFIASDNCAAHIITCKVHEEENISDHLPLSLQHYASPQKKMHLNHSEPKVNWKKADSGPLLNEHFDCLTDLQWPSDKMIWHFLGENSIFEREDFAYDSEIKVEEVEHAFKRLKLRKAGGQDSMMSEHLKFVG